ncbi:MAG: hypothetical protein K8U57_00305 [Planctomycetes bacterium]|nr:hypothetical protein [Planctomycetota bacterium]
MSAATQPATATGDQFYVTHCLTADSVMNSPGYSVRAASAVDSSDVLKRVLEYPPYEIPLDMWREKPTKTQAPRRLARTKNPAGGVWAVHSVYLEKDTMNRDRSYFTHIINLPTSVDAASVLESWDSDAWVKEYAQGAPKSLRKCSVPVGSKISRTTLSAFISKPVSGPTELSAVVCPARFRTDVAARRSLVGRFLKAIILLTEAQKAGEGRDRLFVHAEPGLVAMLLYAATRILPPGVTADLTFSTFEPSHRAIRDYKLATVVGTYLGLPGKGLDQDLVTSRGFGIDAIQPEKSSPELLESQPLTPGISELLELAAAGDWELLEDVHKLIGTEAGAIEKVPATIGLARAVTKLNRGGLGSEDLLALKADRRGAAILAQRADKVWEFLKDAVISDANLRANFKDWIAEPERLKAYRREACEALVKGEFDNWDTRWILIREVADAEQFKLQADHAQKNLDRYLPTMPIQARDRVRAVCAESGVWPDHHLLAPINLDELDSMLATNVSASWQGYTCFAVMGPDEKNWLADASKPYRPSMRERVRHHLMLAPAAVLTGYLKHAKDYVSTMPGFLYDFLRPFRPECIPFLSRLIDAGADVIEAGDWVKLLGELDIYGERTKEWAGFLLKNDHLAKLLGGFKADPAATQVWEGYLNLLGPELINGDEWERIVYMQLTKARQLLGAANVPLKNVAPSGGPRKLKAADTLLGLMANPATIDTMEHGQLLEAFQVFGIEPLDGLRRFYLRCNFPSIDLNIDPRPLKPFADAFQACYPITHEYNSARMAIANWIGLSASCPDTTRGAFQLYFMRECVPVHWHNNILNEAPRIVLHPMAVAQISQVLALMAKSPGEGFADPGSSPTSVDPGEFVSESTKKAKGTRGGGTKRESVSRRKQSEGIPAIVWLLLILVGVGIVAAIAISQLKKKPPETEPTPEPKIIKVPAKVDKDKTKSKDKDKDK